MVSGLSTFFDFKFYDTKIMLPVKDDKRGKNNIADSFHNFDFVCIYDSNLETLEWMRAKDISETAGGLNLSLIQKNVFLLSV